MPVIEWTDFSGGMDGRPGHGRRRAGNAEELRNLFPNARGRLERRRTLTTYKTGNSISWRTFRAGYRADDTHKAKLSTETYWIEMAASALAFDSNGITDLLNYSYSASAGVNHNIYYRESLWAPIFQFENRVFFGIGANDQKHISWMDVTSAIKSTAEAYALGHAAPAAAASLALVADVGDLTDAKYYGVKYTYQNATHGDETVMSASATQLTGGTGNDDLRIRVTMTQIVDQGYDKCRIYMTDPQSTAADAAAAAHKLVGAVSMTNGTSTFTADVDASLLDGGAYTLGAQNATTDHDVLTENPVALEEFAGRLWAALLPNTLRFCKRTTDTVFPEAWPTENEVLIGAIDARITGLKVTPTQDALLIFTEQSIYSLSGGGAADFQVRRVSPELGCPYHRTIATVGRFVYFLGNDNHVWATDGINFQRVSDPVDNILRGIKRYHSDLPVAGVFESQYWLSYPSGDAFLSSSANVTTSSPSSPLMTIGNRSRLTDSTAWDLSTAVVGMYIESNASPTVTWGWITAVNDGSDYVDIEGHDQTGSGQWNIIVNDRTVVFDTIDGWWTQYRIQNLNAFHWWRLEHSTATGTTSRNLVATRSSDVYTVEVAGENVSGFSYLENPGGGVQYPTCFYESEWINFKDPSIVRRFYMHFTNDSAPAVTFNGYLDGNTTAEITQTFTPVQDKRYSLGIHARCRQFKYTISYAPTTNVGQEIERMGLEYVQLPNRR